MSTQVCDCCDKIRSDVRACGRDSNGDPDAPCMCFLCRKEGERGRVWDRAAGAYRQGRTVYDIDSEGAY